MKLLHKIIFWAHLFAGVIAGVVIFIMSATGVILMYEHQLVEYAERDVRHVVPNGGAQRMTLDDVVANARRQNDDARPTTVVVRNEPTASVAVGFGRAGVTYVNPYTAAVLGHGSRLHEWFRTVIDWHRWLGMEGEGPRHRPRHHGRVQFGFLMACRHWSLSLVAAHLGLARFENQPPLQSSPER